MTPTIVSLILGLTNMALDLWRSAENKPAGWEPTQDDWDRLRRNNKKTAQDYESSEQTLEQPPVVSVPKAP